MSKPRLDLHFHPSDGTTRLTGWADVNHPEFDRGVEFHLALSSRALEPALCDLAASIARGGAASFDVALALGQVTWMWHSEKVTQSATWLQLSTCDGVLSLEVVTEEGGPDAEDCIHTEYVLLNLPSVVPSLILDARAHWKAGNRDMAAVGRRSMAGIRRNEPAPSEADMNLLAALRLDGAAVPPQMDPRIFALPVIQK